MVWKELIKGGRIKIGNLIFPKGRTDIEAVKERSKKLRNHLIKLKEVRQTSEKTNIQNNSQQTPRYSVQGGEVGNPIKK